MFFMVALTPCAFLVGRRSPIAAAVMSIPAAGLFGALTLLFPVIGLACWAASGALMAAGCIVEARRPDPAPYRRAEKSSPSSGWRLDG